MINQDGSVNATVATDTPVMAMITDRVLRDAHGNQLVDAGKLREQRQRNEQGTTQITNNDKENE